MKEAIEMNRKTKKRLQKGVLYCVLVTGAAICMMPLYWLIRSSLMDMSQIFQVNPVIWFPDPIVWSNYSEALSELPFAKYFLNTLFVTIFNVAGTLLSASFCAFSFARLKWRGKGVVFACVMSGMMLPYAVTLIPTFIGWQRLGLYGTYAPLMVPPWFGGGAFNIFLLRQFFMTLPRDLDEAALVDGSGYFRIWRQIILPLSKSALIVVGLFSFLGNWNDFFAPLIYLDRESKYTVALGLQLFKGMYNARWDYLMAASAAVLAPALVVFIIGQKQFIEGIALTGVKA